VSSPAAETAGPILCLGEPQVDLICERQIEDLGQADAFVPHFGGPVASTALLAARAGARVTLAGATGGDEWGRWLVGELSRAGVELSQFVPLPAVRTPLALVRIDKRGEPSYTVYGEPGGCEPSGWVSRALTSSGDELVQGCGAVFISSPTLIEEADRALTMRLRERALELDRPVIFAPHLHPHRWRSRTDAAARANACVPGALLVCAERAEAELMTREEDPERAAQALLKAGARNVVITLGSEGALVRGRFRADVPAVAVRGRLLSTVGVASALGAALIARLAATGWYEPAIVAGVPAALIEAARACERWGTTD
jgi:sugar/nucleoside kinase (ribokinase family)